MTTYVLHVARSSGLADVLSVPEDERRYLAFGPRIRLRPTRPFPPLGGRPVGRTGGGAGGVGRFADAGQAVLLAAGAVVVEKLWAWRWYAIAGMGAYVLVRGGVKFFRQQGRNVVHNTGTNSTDYHLGENADSKAILSAYLLEMLQKQQICDLDVYTTTSWFGSDSEGYTGPSVALYCTEHLHLKVINRVNCHTPFMKDIKVALDSMRHMIIPSGNQRDAIKEVGNGVSFCGLSKSGQAIGLLINQELGDEDCWDCCSESVHESVLVGRSYDSMSFMAARRLSSAGVLLEIVPGEPAFIILACDGICNLLQNMGLLQFAYQGVRNGMPLRPLCESLLELIQSSSIKRAVVMVQFKPPCETQ